MSSEASISQGKYDPIIDQTEYLPAILDPQVIFQGHPLNDHSTTCLGSVLERFKT